MFFIYFRKKTLYMFFYKFISDIIMFPRIKRVPIKIKKVQGAKRRTNIGIIH